MNRNEKRSILKTNFVPIKHKLYSAKVRNKELFWYI